MIHRRSGFTLIEIMIAVAIAVTIIFLAIPSLRGLNDEKRLTDSFDRFDNLAKKAQANAVKQQRSWSLVWDQTGKQTSITLRPDDVDDHVPTPDVGSDILAKIPTPQPSDNPDNQTETLSMGAGESFTIERPVALIPPDQAPQQWTFWRSGTCEPIFVHYTGPMGTWVAQYHPLTGHGEIIEQHIAK